MPKEKKMKRSLTPKQVAAIHKNRTLRMSPRELREHLGADRPLSPSPSLFDDEEDENFQRLCDAECPAFDDIKGDEG